MIAASIVIVGVLLYAGIHELATMNRAVTVKGLSTMEVQADYVVWPLNFSVSGNELPSLYQSMNDVKETVIAFLLQKGFERDELSMGNTSIENNWSSYYEHRPEHHYTLNTSIIISTSNVEKVVANQGCQSELLSKGVILQSYDWNIDYQYNGLSDIKPQMIEEATKNARAVAQKFADDSNSRLGGIRQASQGQFSIEADSNKPWMKHIRVVTTVDYYLK